MLASVHYRKFDRLITVLRVRDVYQLVQIEDKLLTRRKEMGGIYGPLEHRLKLMKRRDHLERKENVVRCLSCLR